MEGKGTVLIVDDSAADRALFRTMLTRGGYTVHDVSRGTDALSKAIEIRPHIIVLDVNLPDLNGLEVCRTLRGDGRMASIPVLMLTVRHDDADVLKGLEAGADDYVAKDSAAELVLARVQRLVQYRQLVSHAMLNRQLVQVGRLLAGIIHEIRGPLSVIRGSAELLSMNRRPDDPDLQWVDSILRGTHLLQIRLDHLMATVRSGPAQLRPVELGSLVHEAVELFVKGLSPNNRGVRVQPECGRVGPSVLADAGRIIQVLIDLLSNAHQAIMSGAKEGVIRLGLEAEDEGGSAWIKIDVRDDGPGIPEIYINRVFEPFFTTRDGGTGYGLYLAAEIVKEQGGRLTASNNPEGGACFTIWLPREAGTSSRPLSSGSTRTNQESY
jgi:signal transduction histidine kinase